MRARLLCIGTLNMGRRSTMRLESSSICFLMPTYHQRATSVPYDQLLSLSTEGGSEEATRDQMGSQNSQCSWCGVESLQFPSIIGRCRNLTFQFLTFQYAQLQRMPEQQCDSCGRW